MGKRVVILGGAFAGLNIAHRLLKQTRPSIKDDLEVILVSKSTHFYWNLASVRAIVPDLLTEDQVSQPIAPGFEQYPAEAFRLVVGSATGVDTAARSVTVHVAGGADEVLAYDHLVLATGARAADGSGVPWKSDGGHEDSLEMLRRTQDRVRAASHIVVAGAGATGVETAAELRDAFRDKTVILLAAGSQPLDGDIVGPSAAAELTKLGVEVRTGARVVGTAEVEGKTEIQLESGDKILTDLYLPTMGMTPNTEYLPESILTDRKFVDVDDNFAVKGVEDVWAAGDIVWKPRGSFVLTEMQATGVAKNIDAKLKGKAPAKIKTIPFDVSMVSTGRSRGVGRMGSVKVFSFMVYMIKGKTMGIEKLPKYIDGSQFT